MHSSLHEGVHMYHPAKGDVGGPLGLVGRWPSGPHRLNPPRVTLLLALDGGLMRHGCSNTAYTPMAPSLNSTGGGENRNNTTHTSPSSSLPLEFEDLHPRCFR